MPYYLTQSLHRALRHHPDRIATICGARRRTYRECADRVARFAGALRELGLQDGDRVAMLALNSDRVIEHYLATFWAGGVASPVNIRWSAREVVFALQDCGATVLLVDDAFVALARSAQAEVESLQHLVYIGDGEVPAGMRSYEMLVAAAEPVEDAHRCGTDLALVLYTGGTTGFPKGVMLTHDNLGSAALGSVAMCGLPGPTYLHAVPLFHMAGIQMLCNALIAGSTHVVAAAFDPAVVLDLVEVERPTDTMLVPTMLQMLATHPDAGWRDLSSLARVFYGGAAISQAVLDSAMAAFPCASFIQGYGMTESGLTVMLTAAHHTAGDRPKLRSAGQAVPAAEVRIAAADGREARRDEPGEILVRGPMVMHGYWNQPELTARTLAGGWLHTGDVGTMDDEGFIFIVDRLKDMIVTGGENVYSTEVENAIASHPAVGQCAVIGIPDERWGEAVHAVIVCRPGAAAPTVEELRKHCLDQIAGYKCPRSIELRDALPLSAAGKVLKTALREPYWQGHARGVS